MVFFRNWGMFCCGDNMVEVVGRLRVNKGEVEGNDLEMEYLCDG